MPALTNITINVIENDDTSIEILFKYIQKQITESTSETILDIRNFRPKDPKKKKNDINVLQNSNAWHEVRKNKITSSRLPALLGIYWKSEFNIYWQIILQGLEENDLLSNHFFNFRRGREFKGKAPCCFCDKSMIHVTSCGFFNHPDDSSYGASPDGLVAPGNQLEIKTRAANSDGPLLNIAKNPGYYIQAQIQMVCTDYSYCIIMSYHPESKTANYFLIQKNNLLWSVIKIFVD